MKRHGLLIERIARSRWSAWVAIVTWAVSYVPTAHASQLSDLQRTQRDLQEQIDDKKDAIKERRKKIAELNAGEDIGNGDCDACRPDRNASCSLALLKRLQLVDSSAENLDGFFEESCTAIFDHDE